MINSKLKNTWLDLIITWIFNLRKNYKFMKNGSVVSAASAASTFVTFEFPKWKKLLKLKVSTRTSIKSYVPMFVSKFDADIANLQIVAYQKIGPDRHLISL